MKYLIVENDVITNIIVCDPNYAEFFHTLPYYDGATIGAQYNPPEPEPTELEQLRADVDYIAMETGVEL